MNIKVSGITTFKQLAQLDGLGVDYAGFIFDKASAQAIGENFSKKDIKKADFDIRTAGIFCDPEMIDVLDAIDDYGLDAVQLDGREDAEMCDDLGSEVEVIKSFRIDPSSGVNVDELVAPYDAVCDFYLFDLPLENWQYLGDFRIEKPFFLSGNIGPEDAGMVRAFRHSDFFGIDINSRFEKKPGEKDMALLLKFLQALK